MFRFKWWTAASGGGIDLHFTQTAFTRSFNIDYARWEYRVWCPIQSRDILVGIDQYDRIDHQLSENGSHEKTGGFPTLYSDFGTGDAGGKAE